VFILDHTSKEDRFFVSVKEAGSLTAKEEQALVRQFENLRHQCGIRTSSMAESLEQLEKADWPA
jgi:hypothetical protein